MKRAAILLAALATCLVPHAGAAIGDPAPEIAAERWINSPPQTIAGLRGKVVLVEFWTFACWNCRNVEPYVKEWHAKYRDQGLAVIAVHTPELPHERSVETVEAYCRKNGITHAVAIDNDFAIWERWGNRAWPTIHLIDKRGVVRRVRVGEGEYRETEERIRALLGEAP